ncbi:MAG: TetR/AcrR family transcriptional regulator [Tateyamaria sp.]
MLLHRDDPAKDPLVGNVKVTRQDWINAALAALKSGGVETVKVAELATQLDVSRSSFYWYFKNRTGLLDALLVYWEQTNTAAIRQQAQAPADTVTAACCNLFRCNVDPDLFDERLDFAIRAWGQHSQHVETRVRSADADRIDALAAMFTRFDYPRREALARARVIYYMQLGYDGSGLKESIEDRLNLVPEYIFVYTGRHATKTELTAFGAFARSVAQ